MKNGWRCNLYKPLLRTLPINLDLSLSEPYVAILQAAEFTDPNAGGIKQCDLRLMFGIGYGINNRIDLLPRGNDRQILIEAHIWYFKTVPVFVENMPEEVAELRDMDVNGAGIQTLNILEPEKE